MGEGSGFNASWEPPPQGRLAQPGAAQPSLDGPEVAESASLNTVWAPPSGGLGAPPPSGSPVVSSGPAAPSSGPPVVPTALNDRSTVLARRTAQLPQVQGPQTGVASAAAGYGAVPFTGALPLDTEYATFWTRLGARFIDFFFVLFVFVPVLVGVTAGIAAATGADPLIAALIAVWLDIGLWELAYYLVGASHGQTIGKRVLGIKVCREDNGGRIGFWKALGRMFASILSSLVLYIGWLAPLWTPKHQTWHDSMTHTVVIRDRKARLATPAVVWGLVWTLISGGAFGGLAVWGINAIEDAGYDLQRTSESYGYDYGTDEGLSDYDSGDDYSDEGDGYTEPDQGDSFGDESLGGGESYGGADPQLDSLADECETGSMSSCDDLYSSTGQGTDLEAFAMTCGGRRSLPVSHTSCVAWDNEESRSRSYDDDYSGGSSGSSGYRARSSGSLESIAADMDSQVRALSGSWVVQLSSSTTYTDNQAGIAPMSEYEILDRLNTAEARYSGTSYTPLLLWTGDYNFKYSDMWVVVLDRRSDTYEGALGFCASEGYGRDHCLAKYLDQSSNWDHTSKMMPRPGEAD